MYRKIEPALRMTRNEASEHYPDNFVIMQMGSMKLSDDVGTVLYVGDSRVELYGIIKELKLSLIGVIEGLNHQRNCLGGVVACR
jgi:hypothetical protein